MKNYVCVSNTNTKLGAAIANINLPALITCRADAPCRKEGCYACHGNFLYPNVQKALKNNLDAYNNNSKMYFNSIIEQTRLYKYVRWHSSGDIYNDAYFAGMCHVARINKETKYLCFTKKYEIINNYLESGKRIPTNLSIVFSAWNNFIPVNPYNLPMAWVAGKNFNNEIIPPDSIPCAGHCDKCQACWSLKKRQNIYFKKH